MVRSIVFLILAQVCGMSLWFTGASLAPGLVSEFGMSANQVAAMTTSVQLGFVVGGLTFALSGLVDRLSPRKVFFASALVAALTTLGVLSVNPSSHGALTLRFLTGFSLAGVYPVGMAIAVSYGQRNRGLLVGLLVGALTLGSALPHLLASVSVDDWRLVVQVSGMLGALAAVLILFVPVGPHYVRAPRFSMNALSTLTKNKPVRRAYGGYFGHMWELYAFWAWLGPFLAIRMPASKASMLAFMIIGLGAIACIAGGIWSVKVGKLTVARTALWGSLVSGGVTIGALWIGSETLLLIALFAWGVTIIPDSPQFSAMVADHAPSDQAGSLITLQTALGFALTAVTIQAMPILIDAGGWTLAFGVLTLGPVAGLMALRGQSRTH